jgi:hypothetical protein
VKCGELLGGADFFGGPAATGLKSLGHEKTWVRSGHLFRIGSLGRAPIFASRFRFLAVARCARTNALSAAQTGRGTESEASSNVPINRSITSDSVTRTSIDRVHHSRDHRACAKKHRAFQRNLDA